MLCYISLKPYNINGHFIWCLWSFLWLQWICSLLSFPLFFPLCNIKHDTCFLLSSSHGCRRIIQSRSNAAASEQIARKEDLASTTAWVRYQNTATGKYRAQDWAVIHLFSLSLVKSPYVLKLHRHIRTWVLIRSQRRAVQSLRDSHWRSGSIY